MRKSRVYKAKQNNLTIILLSIIIGEISWLLSLNLIIQAPTMSMIAYYTFITLVSLVMGICTTLIGMIFNWSNLQREMTQLKTKRFIFFYNRCLRAFTEKDYEKIKDIYDKILIKDKSYSYHTANIRLAYRVATKQNLNVEQLYLPNNNTPPVRSV